MGTLSHVVCPHEELKNPAATDTLGALCGYALRRWRGEATGEEVPPTAA
jgi:hypothetical protein